MSHPLNCRANATSLALTTVVLITAGACTNAEPAAPGPVPGTPVEQPPTSPEAPAAAGCEDGKFGRSPLRRLSRFEYDNAVRDLFGDTSEPARALPPEAEISGFDNDADSQTVSSLLAGKYLELAHDVAVRAAEQLSSWFSCDAAALGEAACAEQLITTVGERSFRRPLDTGELDRLRATFARALPGGGFEGAAHELIETVLASPQFLYRLEPDDAAALGPRRLLPHELAARLSFALWGSTPDAALTEAARQSGLESDAQIAAQVERMLADPKARPLFRHFHDQWLHLGAVPQIEKDPAVYPTFRPELRPLLREETQRFVEHVLFEAGGGTEALLTAPFSFINQELAEFYGVPGVTGSEFRRVELGQHRAGLLTQGSILALQAKANRSEPIYRGVFVRTDLMCQPIPDPPDNVPPPPELAGPTTERVRLEAHRAAPECAGCHQLFDPIGLAFENYDGAGLWRDSEQGLPIDASGEIVASDSAGAFVGVQELSQKLAASREFNDCLVTKWFTHVFGRVPESPDVCTLQAAAEQFRASGYHIHELVKALTLSSAFRHRDPSASKEQP
jgi:hypothetical protein